MYTPQAARSDVPINLPSAYKVEAQHLRNQLLTFRLRHGGKPIEVREPVDPWIEPRLSQVFAPLLAIIDDQKTRQDLRTLARSYNRDLITDRSQEPASPAKRSRTARISSGTAHRIPMSIG